jgi:hypothetical protein
MSTVQDIGLMLQGMGAGLHGQGNMFQRNLMLKEQLQQESEDDRRKQTLARQKLGREMAVERQKTVFTDSAAALKLGKNGRFDLVAQLGQNRLRDSQHFPGVDFSHTEQLTELATMAANGNKEAESNLMKSLENNVAIGRSMGLLDSPAGPQRIPNKDIGPMGNVTYQTEGGPISMPSGRPPVVKDTTTEDMMARLTVRLKNMELNEREAKSVVEKQAIIDTKKIKRSEALNGVDVINGLLKDDNYTHAFGRSVHMLPEYLRSQQSIDTKASVDQITALISLDSREKLKGSGTISDGEAKTLAQSATILANPLISDAVAERELRRVLGVFQDSADRNRLHPKTREEEKRKAGNPSFRALSGQTVTYEDLVFSAQESGKTVEEIIKMYQLQPVDG